MRVRCFARGSYLDDGSQMYYYCNVTSGDTAWDDPRVGNEAYAAGA